MKKLSLLVFALSIASLLVYAKISGGPSGASAVKQSENPKQSTCQRVPSDALEVSQSCIGVKLNNKWLGNPFDKNAKMNVGNDRSGKITVEEALENGTKQGAKLPFKLFIKRNNVFFVNGQIPGLEGDLMEVDLETVLKHFQKGDQIIIQVKDSSKYEPDLHEIFVGGTC